MKFSIFEKECGCGGSCCGAGDTLGAILPGATETDPPIHCLHGNAYQDPNGVWHCPSNVDPICPAGQHVEGNYHGERICAPNECPPGHTMGWSTDGRRVICAPPAQTPAPPVFIPGGTPGPVPAPAPGAQPTTIFGLSPLMLLAIAGGGILLFSMAGDSPKGR